MATIPFYFTYAKSGNNQVLTQTAYAPPPSGDIFDNGLPYEGKLTNTKTSAVYNLSSSNMAALIKVSIDGVFGTYTHARPDLLDGVCEASITYNNFGGILYQGKQYLLYVGDITASIASLPSGAVKTFLTEQLALVTTYFNAAQYTEANDQITLIEFLLNVSDEDRANTLTKISSSVLRNIITEILPSVPDYAYVAYDTTLTNTLTTDDVDLTLLEYPSSETDVTRDFSSAGTFAKTIYDDGVYKFRDTFLTYPIDMVGYPLNNIVQSYALVITTIQVQFATYEANYDPNNTDQADAYADMLTAFATITTLSSDLATNFAAINAQIVIIQGLLELFVDVTATLTLTDKSNLLITLDNANMPNVVYNTQVLTLSNTNDNTQEYILEDAFPLNYVDVTKTLNSDTINFGSQFADAVYQMNVSWNSENSMTFNAQAYCLVTTQIDCGIAGIIAKRPNCKPLVNKLNELMTYKRMIIDSFGNADYSTTNFYINKCLNLLNSNGCNCGCS